MGYGQSKVWEGWTDTWCYIERKKEPLVPLPDWCSATFGIREELAVQKHIGILRIDAKALCALLRNYPHIVALALGFVRRLMLQYTGRFPPMNTTSMDNSASLAQREACSKIG